MPSEPICCPYCNAYVALPVGTVQDGQRLLCSRCGETFTFRGFPTEAITPAIPHPLTPFTPQPEAGATLNLSRRGWPNWAIALALLGGMAVMACVGLGIALATQDIRRAHDAGLPKDRRLPLYLTVFVAVWGVGLAVVAVRELRVRHQRLARGEAAPPLPVGYVLATIGFIAVAGLAVTVLAVQISAQRASRPALGQTSAPVQAVAPAALAGLGYLPSDCDLVAGIHVAEALQDPLAREFLTRFQLGGVDLNTVEKWTSLKAEDLDHVALGLRVQGNLLPRLTMVVRTIRPYDAEAVRKAVNASRAPERGKKEMYRLKLEKSLLTPYLWFADERTLVLGLSAADLAPVPRTPRPQAEHLAPEIAGFLQARLSPGTQLWLAGHAENWDKTLLWGLLLARENKENAALPLLAKVRTFGVGFQLGNDIVLNAAVQCADDDSAGAVEALLTGKGPKEQQAVTMPPPRPELEPIYRELGQSLKSERKGRLDTLQAKASAETLKKALNR